MLGEECKASDRSFEHSFKIGHCECTVRKVDIHPQVLVWLTEQVADL